MKFLNIHPIRNVSYRFEFNPVERLYAMLKNHHRKVLLTKMLDYPDPKSNPLKAALFQTFCEKSSSVKVSIPRFIKKA